VPGRAEDHGRQGGVDQKGARNHQDLNKPSTMRRPNAAHELTDLRDRFLKNLETTHPQMKAAREAYAAHSRGALDLYERSGALKKAVSTDPYSGDAILDPEAIKKMVLRPSGAEAAGRLVEKNPALRESIRRVFQGQLHGIGEAAKPPTTEQLRKFLTANRRVLESTGLYDDFARMHTERTAAEAAFKTETEKAAAQTKESIAAAKEQAGAAEKARKEAEAATAAERRLSQEAAKRRDSVGKDLTKPEDVAKGAESRVKEAQARLKEQGKGVEAERSETQKKIDELARTKTQAENTRAAFEKLDTRMNAASTPGQVISAARSAADALIDKRVIDKDRYRELLLQIQDVEKKETSHTRMATLVRQAIIAAAVAGGGALAWAATNSATTSITASTRAELI
jgi:myosin heavy subunit